MKQKIITPGVRDSLAGPMIEAAVEGQHAAPALLESIVAYATTAVGGEMETAIDPIPQALVPFVDKVVSESYKILDRDYETLAAAGYSEEEAIDIVLAATAGAVMGRMQIGLSAMGKQI